MGSIIIPFNGPQYSQNYPNSLKGECSTDCFKIIVLKLTLYGRVPIEIRTRTPGDLAPRFKKDQINQHLFPFKYNIQIQTIELYKTDNCMDAWPVKAKACRLGCQIK